MPAAAKTGVCLLNLGGPESLEDVEPFLHALFNDRELIRLPGGPWLQRPLASWIARTRAPKVRARYQRIGGGSPLVRIARQQAALLARELARSGEFAVEIAMRYSPPRTAEAIARLAEQGITRLVALPLYPQYSAATTGSSLRDVEEALAKLQPHWELVRIADFHDQPRYLDALAGTVRHGLSQLGGPAPVLFSAHSLPRKLVERGDPYVRQVEATVRGVVERLGLDAWHLAYQSRSGPVRWLEPNVLDVVARLGAAGARRLLVVPVSFVSDHLETLHELDIEMREHALAQGIVDFARAPALNEDATFITALTEVVLAACA